MDYSTEASPWYLAAMELHTILEEHTFETLIEVHDYLVRTQKDGERSDLCRLYTQLVYNRWLHMGCVADFKEAIDCLSVNDNGLCKDNVEDIITILLERNPTKYSYVEQECVVVSDTDFLNPEELLADDYQAIYGVLYHPDEDSIYESLILNLRKVGTKIYRQITLSSWEEHLNTTIERLQEIKDANPSRKVRVRVPFFNEYDEDIAKTLALYKYTRFLVRRMIQDSIYDDEEIKDVPTQQFLVPSLYKAFDTYIEYLNMLRPEEAIYVFEEMVRRGLKEDYKQTLFYGENGYRKYVLRDKSVESSSSKDKDEIEEALIKRVGVLYCMLYGHINDNALLTRIAHFALSDKKEFKERASANTEYTYIAKPLERLFGSFENEGYIEEKLSQYGFPNGTLDKIKTELRAQKENR